MESVMRSPDAAGVDLHPPLVTEDLLRRLDVPGPRYTSYPTADRFVEAFGPEDYRRALWQRGHTER